MAEIMSSHELTQKLKDLGFGQYSNLFLSNEITGADISYVTEDHLIEMGIDVVGHRLLLLKKLSELANGKNPDPVTLKGASRPDPISQTKPTKRETERSRKPTRQEYVESSDDDFEPERPAPAPSYSRPSQQYKQVTPKAISKAAYNRQTTSAENTQQETNINTTQSSDDRVVCQYCGRKFLKEAAARHIPVCGRIRGKLDK